MDLFEFKNYKQLILSHIQTLPKNGHGQFNRLAQHLRVHSTMISHIFNGDKNLTSDQAYGVCDYFGFTEIQTDYFLLLVEQDKAANHKLKNYYDKKLAEIRKKAQSVSEHLPQDHVFSEEDKATFYSQWYYSGVRLLSAIPEYRKIDAISDYFGLSKKKISEILEFLVRTGLCKVKNGEFIYGPTRTHVEAESPLANRHHINWRLKAIEQLERMEPDELVFTSPVVIEKKDAIKIRKLILEFLQNADRAFEKSGSEELFCLNVDWVRIQKM